MACIGTLRPAQARSIIETVAGYHNEEITRANPTLEAEFPLDGSRFAGQIPPTVVEGGYAFTIRKKPIAVFTLAQYVEEGVMTEAQRQVLVRAVEDHKNILVAGGTGSGKTTLVNAIIRQMVEHDPHERFILIEDTREIQCTAANYVQYRTSATVDMTALLRTTLRMRPDRILVGEVRGPEALDLLMAWNTGHSGGAATIHADNEHSTLDRLKELVSMHPNPPKPIEPLIGRAVHIVVYIAHTHDAGRRVQAIMEVCGFSNSQYITKTLL